MIFATVGTHRVPFPRMLSALSEVDDEVVVQYGCSPRPSGFAWAEPYMPHDVVLALLERARGVVTHAGVGSVLCALEAGHTPVVVPRMAKLGEHVDDHQSELARALEARGDVVVLWDASGLADALRRAGARGPRRALVTNGLHAAVRELIAR